MLSSTYLCVTFDANSQEIARREQALQERERNLERLGSADHPKNFPPFPKFCPYPLKPCFYINVKVEVPPSEQWKVYSLFALLICECLHGHACSGNR